MDLPKGHLGMMIENGKTIAPDKYFCVEKKGPSATLQNKRWGEIATGQWQGKEWPNIFLKVAKSGQSFFFQK